KLLQASAGMVMVLEWAQSRLRAEALIALGAFLVGIVDIVTAIRPTLTDRYDLFQAMLPTGTTTLAGSITFAAVAHLGRGFDLEEALGSAALLGALLALRRRFDVSGDPTSIRPLAGGIA